MWRKSLTDGTGRWFDAETAELIGKIQRDNVRGQYEEHLWFTPNGVYVLEKVNYENSECYRVCKEVKSAEAVTWLSKNDFETPEWFDRHLKQI